MLRLRLREIGQIPIEAGELSPDRVVNMTLSEVARVPLLHGNRLVPIGELFDLEGSPADGIVTIEGNCRHLKRIGNSMGAGTLQIQGDAGCHLGAGMSGGQIEVWGSSGDWLGAEMRGGRIRVHGNAGNRVGGASLGATKGMRGGVILVDGDVGQKAGNNMRRGLIAVRGRCGEMTGHALIAGSIFAFSGLGPRSGAGMKRGTLLGIQNDFQPVPTFRPSCSYGPTFVHLYLKQLEQWNFPVPSDLGRRTFQRFCGDLLSLGKGEILIAPH